MKVKKQETTASSAPIFTIDLSLKPRERYKAIAGEYKRQLQGLTALFNDLLYDLGLSETYHGFVNRLAKLLLRGVHSSAETAELRGISEVTGIPMYLLVSLNVILDLLMGCTSGAVKSLEAGNPNSQATMLHFRTLDWTMDPLRSVIVQLEFVRSKSAHPCQVLARSITYVGFVGVLTGVRQKLSLSLNFRGVHNANSKYEHARFYLHHLLVLLGYRQSISSILRSYLIPDGANKASRPKTLAEISEELAPRHTTAAYLIFSDGGSTIVLEKDYRVGLIRHSETFIAATNHDEMLHGGQKNESTPAANELAAGPSRIASGMEELFEESQERLDCIASKWRSRVRKTKAQSRRKGEASVDQSEADTTITEREVIDWVSAYPTTNEQTHFAAVLDAAKGRIVWNCVYLSPSDGTGECEGSSNVIE